MIEHSIMPSNPHYEIERRDGLHRHEVFFASNRQNSIKYGLYVFLTPENHNMSNKGVHSNRQFDIYLKKIGQKAFEEYYPDLDFKSIFHLNYL